MIPTFDPHARQIRRQVFARSFPLDQDLIRMVQGVETHRFLTNPASHQIFLYLTEFVKACSEAHWDRSITELRMLDWGCGKGQISYLLRKHGAILTSCDRVSGQEDSSFHQQTPILDQTGISVDALDHDIYLPYEDSSMDGVLSVGVLEHVRDDRASLQEIYRILKPGGLFFCFFLPQTFSWTQRLAHVRGNTYHDRLYSRSQVYQLMGSTGFQILDFWYRQILPKNSIRYPAYRQIELIDQWITDFSPLRCLATNIEFVACKNTSSS